MNRLTTGAVAAVGVGVGAALAASLGPVAYALAFTGSLGALAVGRHIQRRRR